MYDVTIVGGGIAGLTAASYLAHAGCSVALFERQPTLGGRAATSDVEGFRFNRGGHALYTGGAASDVLRELRVHYRAGVPKRVFGLTGGRRSPLPTTPRALLTTRLLDPLARFEWLRLLFELARIDARTLGRTTIADWIAARVHRPDTRRMIAAVAQAFVYSTALDLVSADVLVAKLQRALRHPVHYIDGGWQTLVDGLAQAAATAGVRITTGAPVEAVVLEGTRAVGLRVGGQFVAADAVLLATTPAAARRLVVGGESAALRRVVDPLVPAPVACLDIALRRLPEPAHPVIFDLDQPRFVTAQSVFADVAPAGAALLHAVKWLDPRRLQDPAVDERDLERLLDAVQPGWRALLVKRFFLPRIAAVGALPLAAQGGLAGRPDVVAPGIDGLYLAGDWVGSEGFLVDASASSARRAAGAILARQAADCGTVGERSVTLAR